MSNLGKMLISDAEAVEKALEGYLAKENEKYPVCFRQ